MKNLVLTKKRIKKSEKLHAAQLATFKKGNFLQNHSFWRKTNQAREDVSAWILNSEFNCWHSIYLGGIRPHFYESKNTDTRDELLFLKVKSRDTVLVGENEICKVLAFTGGSRDPEAPSLFQVANVDMGGIKHVHADDVKEIVSTYEEEVQQRQQQQWSNLKIYSLLSLLLEFSS